MTQLEAPQSIPRVNDYLRGVNMRSSNFVKSFNKTRRLAHSIYASGHVVSYYNRLTTAITGGFIVARA